MNKLIGIVIFSLGVLGCSPNEEKGAGRDLSHVDLVELDKKQARLELDASPVSQDTLMLGEMSEIDSVSMEEVMSLIDDKSLSIYDCYRKEELGDYMTFAEKMFGRCCSNTDLRFTENLYFKISSNFSNEKYPIENISDTQYLTAFVFQPNSKVKMKLQIDLDNSFLQGRYSNRSLLHSNDVIMNPIKLSLINGYVKSEELFYKNSRVKELNVYVNGQYIESITLIDTPLIQEFQVDAIFSATDSITLEPKTYYRGTEYSDVCISEIQTNLGRIALPDLNEKYDLMELMNRKE